MALNLTIHTFVSLLLVYFYFVFIVYLESDFFICSLPYGSLFSPTWNLGLNSTEQFLFYN